MTVPVPRLRRNLGDRRLGGVCSGLARRYGLSTGGLRLAFVLSCVLPGPQILAYLVLGAVIPADRGY